VVIITRLAPLSGQFAAKLVEVSEAAAGVKKFTLEAKMNFKPGQFVMLEIPGFPQRRAFSICSAPGEQIEVAAKVAGVFTQKLSALKAGEELLVAGPFGNFAYDPSREAVFLAGGVGITPFRSMLRYAASSNRAKKITLLYSSKSAADIAFRKELEALRSQSDRKIVFTLTREAPEGWQGEIGRIDADMLKRYDGGENAVYYICGSPIFVSAMENLLAELKVPKERIRTERFFGVADQ